MAKKRTSSQKKQDRKLTPKQKITNPRPASAAKVVQEQLKKETKPQLVNARPLSDAKLLKKSGKSSEPAAPSPRPENPPEKNNPNQHESKKDKPAFQLSPMPSAAPAAIVSTKPAPAATVDTASSRTGVKRSDRHGSARKLLRYGVILLFIAALPAAGLWLFQKHEQASQTANQRLASEISRRAVVPTDEVPSVSTVTDTSKINQQFLRNAKKGDKVLVYFQASEAVVYRPSTGQIVNMGPLSAPSPRVWLRAGTPKADIPGIGQKTNATGDFVVVSNDVSPEPHYQHTIVVDLNGNRPDIAKRLATVLHAAVGQLPDGESRPDADLLVIVGSDRTRP